MPRNKIGIEVSVQFPTVKELQNQLAEKWAKVKNNFEAKINVGVDGNSIKQLKKKIDDALSDKVFDVKLNFDNLIDGIRSIAKEIEKLDNELQKTRELKIKFSVADLDKSFREILENAKRTEDIMKKGQTGALKQQNSQLDAQIDKISKLHRIQKQLKDGSYATTLKLTENKELGSSKVITLKPNGRVNIEQIENREKALKEIEQLIKRIHRIELEQVKAEGEHFELLEKERRVQQQQLDLLSGQYKEKYKMNYLDDESIKELMRQQEVLLEIKMTNAINNTLKKEEAQAQKEINDAVARVAQLEAKKLQLSKQMITASEDEKQALKEQYDHHNRIQQEIMKKYNLSKNMTDEQRAELQNIRNIGILEIQREQAKKQQIEQEKQLSAQEKAREQERQLAMKTILADLKKEHEIRQKIAWIEGRANNGGQLSNADRALLATLQEELNVVKANRQEAMRHFVQEGFVTSEFREQVRQLAEINRHELQRIQKSAEIQAKQDQISAQLKEHERLTRVISQLQRDLIFAGIREETVIEKQIEQLKEKQLAIRENLRAQGAITKAMEEEIRAIERAQAEMHKLSRERQNAREKDVEFNDAGGLIDPYSFYANVKQGAMAVFEPVQRLDEAMVKVMKVAEATDEQFKEFKDTVYDVGSSLGVSADEYVMAVEKWVTAGKSFAEAQELARASLVGSFVGNISPDEMVKYMSVPLNVFEKEGLKAVDIINVMNETANKNAVEMEELGKAYMRSASTVKDVGVTFDQLTAYIASAQEQTRIGGERIGTALKTISINIGQINAQLTKDTQKRFAFFKNIGVQFRDANGEMRTMHEIIGDLAKVWDSLSASQKTTAKYYLAGKEHANILGAIIEQWERVEQVSKTSKEQLGLGEMGSAFIEHAKQADSVKFKLAELKNAWDKLMNTISNGSGGVADVMDVLIEGLEELNDLAQNDKLMEALKYILAGVAIHAGANLWRRFFDTLRSGFESFKQNLKETKKIIDEIRLASSTEVIGAGRLGDDINKHNNNSDPVFVGNIGGRSFINNDDEKRLDRTSSKLKKTGQLLGKLAGFIPILGDAILVLDFMGIPVFDKMREMLDNMVTTTKELNAEMEESNKKLIARNSILNGSAIENDRGLAGLESMFKKDLSDDGYMSSDEFNAFKEQFNKFTEELGYVDIKVTMNDTTHIQEQLDALKKKLMEVKEADLLELGNDGFIKQEQQILIAKDKIAEEKAFIEEYTNKIKAWQSIIDELNAKKANGVILTPNEVQLLLEAQNHVDNLNNAISNSKNIIADQKQLISTATNSIETYTQKLITYVNNGGSLKGMNHEAIKKALGIMITDYNRLQDSVSELDKASRDLASGNKIQEASWNTLQAKFPVIAQFSADEINRKRSVRNEVKKIIDAEKEKMLQQQKATKTAIDGASSEVGAKIKIDDQTKKISVANKNLAKDIRDVRDEVDKIKPKKEITFIARVKKVWSDLWDFITGGDKTVSTTVEATDKSISSTPINSVQSVVSASVSSNGNVGGNLIKTPASITSIDKASSSKSKNKSSNSSAKNKSSNSSARVNSDVWRYWGTQLYGLDHLENKLHDLQLAFERYKDNEAKLIELYKTQQLLLKQQINQYKKLKNAKDSEINSVLLQLKKYGFKVDARTNQILNLGHAKNLKGENAEKAEQLLNTWKSLYEEINNINEKIKDINGNIENINRNIKEAQIKKEYEGFEATLKRIDALLKKVNNSNDLTEKILSLTNDRDKELKLVKTEQALNNAKSNLSQLITEFNNLSKSTINYKENGEALQPYLEKIASEILAQADAIIKYQQALNDLEFERVVSDLNEFNNAVDENNNKINNNIKNLKEGLLSGTTLGDLQSAVSSGLDLNRDNKYEQLAQERINLEKEVQDALDAFAKKNIERAKNVANTQLDITANMYNQMLKMASDYTAGNKATYKQIVAEFKNLSNVGLLDKDYKFVKELDEYFKKVQQKQDELTKKYQKDMSKATSADEKDALTNQYIIDSLKIQEGYYNATIKANKEAIAELQNQLNDPSLTDDQKENIQKQIDSYEKEIIEAQNNVKETIKERFDFEFSLLDKVIKEYDKYSSELKYSMSIINAIDGDNYSAKGTIMDEMLRNEQARNAEIRESIESLEKQLSMYERGSYEWNIINEQVEEYKKLLQDSNKDIIEMNRNILSNSFEDTINKIEKEMFNGKTLNQFKEYQELWLEGLEREIALEDTYQRLAEIGTSMYNEKMALLEKQEKLSKFEMDYLNKQLDILELQQKLENLNKDRTVQVLKQQADGTWDWVYEADAEQIKRTQDELAQKQLELQQLRDKAGEGYLDHLNKILEDAERGNFDSVEEFQQALDELNKAYESILSDLSEIQDGYLKNLVNAYSKYIIKNNNVINDTLSALNASTPPLYQQYGIDTGGSTHTTREDFYTTLRNKIAHHIGGAFAETFTMPTFNPIGKSVSTRSISITIENIEFPNIKTADGIKEAILNLPNYALQKSREKL